MSGKNLSSVFPIHIIQAKEMILTKKAIRTTVKFLAKKRAETLFLSSFTFINRHEGNISQAKVC